MVKMTKEEFIVALNNLNIHLTKEALDALEIYASFLLEYNEHTNLTAIKTMSDVYLKHFYDSLTISKLANFTSGKLLDVGTGAGFPGMVLAICFPNLQVDLLDSNNKKIKFLEELIKKLNLTNVQTIYSRAEDYTRVNREKYDYVTSRAVADLRVLLELNIPSLKINGEFLVMKGNIDEELKLSQNALEKLFCTITKQEEFTLPFNSGTRNIMVIKKNKETPSIYPRNYDKIKKRPL